MKPNFLGGGWAVAPEFMSTQNLRMWQYLEIEPLHIWLVKEF